MIKNLIIIFVIFNIQFLYSQNSVSEIDTSSFNIKKYYSNGELKVAGNTILNTKEYFGTFYFFDKKGNVRKTKSYEDGERLNRKILGLRHGKWVVYSSGFRINRYFFFGIKNRRYR